MRPAAAAGKAPAVRPRPLSPSSVQTLDPAQGSRPLLRETPPRRIVSIVAPIFPFLMSPAAFLTPPVLLSAVILHSCGLTTLLAAKPDVKAPTPPAKEQPDGRVIFARILPGTWSWKAPKKSDATDILLSFDESMNVVGTARLGDSGLVVSPGVKPTKITLAADSETGIKSPATGLILTLPLPGIQAKPARLLIKSYSEKKLDCVDLADTEKPVRFTITKTNERVLHDIAGPAQSTATIVPADEPPPTPAPAPASTSAPATTDAVRPSAPPARRGAMSLFQRLKAEQAQKKEEEAAEAAKSTPPPSIPPSVIYNRPSRPVSSVFQRLKAEQAQKKDEPEAKDEKKEDATQTPPAKTKTP